MIILNRGFAAGWQSGALRPRLRVRLTQLLADEGIRAPGPSSFVLETLKAKTEAKDENAG